MIGKIGLEEHFAMPETLQDSAGFVPGNTGRNSASGFSIFTKAVFARWMKTAWK